MSGAVGQVRFSCTTSSQGAFGSPGHISITCHGKEVVNTKCEPFWSKRGNATIEAEAVWAQPTDGTGPLKNGGALKGKVVLMHRGRGHHLKRLREADFFDAAMVIFFNNDKNSSLVLDIGGKADIYGVQIPHECFLELERATATSDAAPTQNGVESKQHAESAAKSKEDDKKKPKGNESSKGNDKDAEENKALVDSPRPSRRSSVSVRVLGNGHFHSPGVFEVRKGDEVIIQQTCSPFWSKRGEFDIEGEVMWAQPDNGSGPLRNGVLLKDKIVMMHRANDNHLERIREAESFGAAAVIFVNDGRSQKLDIGGTTNIFAAQIPHKRFDDVTSGTECVLREVDDDLGVVDEEFPPGTLTCEFTGSNGAGWVIVSRHGEELVRTPVTPFLFGRQQFSLRKPLVWAVPDTGVGDLENDDELDGCIALVVRNHLGPSFYRRIKQLEAAGAVGAVFLNDHRPLLKNVEAGKQKEKVTTTIPGTLIDQSYEDVLRSLSTDTDSLDFRPGQKVEALGPKPSHVTVGTIRRVSGHRALVRVDGSYAVGSKCEFWTDLDGGEIAPPGTCAHNGLKLVPPPGEKHFDWAKYLAATHSFPAPLAAFKPSGQVFQTLECQPTPVVPPRSIVDEDASQRNNDSGQSDNGGPFSAERDAAIRRVIADTTLPLTCKLTAANGKVSAVLRKGDTELVSYTDLPSFEFADNTFEVEAEAVWSRPRDGASELENAGDLEGKIVLTLRNAIGPSFFRRAREISEMSKASAVVFFNDDRPMPERLKTTPQENPNSLRTVPGCVLPNEVVQYFEPLLRPGQKVEVLDPRPYEIVPATIVRVEGGQALVHYDGYPSDVDAWVQPLTGNIAPIYTAAANGLKVSHPKGGDLDWDQYLAEESAKAAPLGSFDRTIGYFSALAARPPSLEKIRFPFPQKQSLWVRVGGIPMLSVQSSGPADHGQAKRRYIEGAGAFCLVTVLDARGEQTETHMSRVLDAMPLRWNQCFEVQADSWSTIVVTVLEMMDKGTRASRFLGQVEVKVGGEGYWIDVLPSKCLGVHNRKLHPLEIVPKQLENKATKADMLEKAKRTSVSGRLQVELSLTRPEEDKGGELSIPAQCVVMCL